MARVHFPCICPIRGSIELRTCEQRLNDPILVAPTVATVLAPCTDQLATVVAVLHLRPAGAAAREHISSTLTVHLTIFL